MHSYAAVCFEPAACEAKVRENSAGAKYEAKF